MSADKMPVKVFLKNFALNQFSNQKGEMFKEENFDIRTIEPKQGFELGYEITSLISSSSFLLQMHLNIDRSNHVWATDITYIPMRQGFVYLVAIMDWYSRRVLAWRLSNTLSTDFCIEALEEAIARYGTPEIFNTDQGSQFTSAEFTGVLKAHGIRISMDGKACWRDNVFVERLWRTVKYEEVYLKAYDTVSAAKASLGVFFDYYNRRRPHQSLDDKTPDIIYFAGLPEKERVA